MARCALSVDCPMLEPDMKRNGTHAANEDPGFEIATSAPKMRRRMTCPRMMIHRQHQLPAFCCVTGVALFLLSIKSAAGVVLLSVDSVFSRCVTRSRSRTGDVDLGEPDQLGPRHRSFDVVLPTKLIGFTTI